MKEKSKLRKIEGKLGNQSSLTAKTSSDSLKLKKKKQRNLDSNRVFGPKEEEKENNQQRMKRQKKIRDQQHNPVAKN